MSELWEILSKAFNDGPLWFIWGAQFVVIEAAALFNKKDGDTLSEVLRYIFGFSKRSQSQPWGMKGRRLSFWAFTAWFVPHIATNWW